MNEPLNMLFALVAGVVLGISFFYSLWITVQKGLRSAQPVYWFIGGFILRMGLSLIAFYLISNQQFWLLISCLIGFLIGRIVTNRMLSISAKPNPV